MQMNGKFPYPFLNKIPFPSGFIATAMVSGAVMASFFQLGAVIKYRLGKAGRPHLATELRSRVKLG